VEEGTKQRINKRKDERKENEINKFKKRMTTKEIS
jgi:hypothetical protein